MASRTKPAIRTYSRKNRVYSHRSDTGRCSSPLTFSNDDRSPPLHKPTVNGPSHRGSQDAELQNSLQDDLTTMTNNVALIERVRVVFLSAFPSFELFLSTEFERGKKRGIGYVGESCERS